MEQEFDFVELFGGICGFLQGFLQAGWKFNNHYYSEIDKHAIAATKYNFKNSIHVGSVEHITGNQLSRNAIFTFGSPCQDFSIAGKRAGMGGKRSSLIGQAIRLIDEYRPPVFIWENVKGAYSSNEGRDFQAILREFANLGVYRLEGQLLNTSWVLPQNRERIYLVGHLAGRSWPGVFPFAENDRLFNQLQATKRQWEKAQHIGTTLKNSGSKKVDDTYISIPKLAGTLTAGGNSGGLHRDMTIIETGTLRTHKDGEGFRKMEGNISPALNGRARQDGSQQTIIKIQPFATPDYSTKTQNGKRIKEENAPSFTLDCNAPQGIMITTNTAAGFDVAKEGDSINLAVPTSKTRRGRVGKSKSQTLDCASNQAVVQKSTIRRLTEIECERLQGFPDDWTKYGIYLDKEGKEVKRKIPKTQRYKLCGNAVTTNIVEIIATKLKDCLITQ